MVKIMYTNMLSTVLCAAVLLPEIRNMNVPFYSYA